MLIIIELKNGKWTINDKTLNECNLSEKMYFDKYIQIHKEMNQMI